MTTELEILRRWEAEQQYYDAWGKFIVHAVIDGLSTQVEAPICSCAFRLSIG